MLPSGSYRDNTPRDNVSSSVTDGNLIVRRGCDDQQQGGRGPGWCARVNARESPRHVVTANTRKRLRRVGPKASGQGQGLLTHLTQMRRHRRRGETHPTRGRTRNVGQPVALPEAAMSRLGKRTARGAEGAAGMGSRHTRRPLCHGAERRGARATALHAQAGRLPRRVFRHASA